MIDDFTIYLLKNKELILKRFKWTLYANEVFVRTFYGIHKIDYQYTNMIQGMSI